MGVKAKQPARYSVKRPGPANVVSGNASPDRVTCATRLAEDPCGASCHLCGCATGESQEQDALRIRSVENEPRDAVGKGLRLSSTRARDDQKRRKRPAKADSVFDRCLLAFVEVHKISRPF